MDFTVSRTVHPWSKPGAKPDLKPKLKCQDNRNCPVFVTADKIRSDLIDRARNRFCRPDGFQMSDTPRAQFIHTISGPEADIDLTLACHYISAEEYPVLDVEAYAQRVDGFGERAKAHLGRSDGTYDVINAINRVLFDEEGFAGNRKNYYDPANSYLCDVIDRRTGIPISLSVLYAEVGRRMGHVFDGVGLPGHFVLVADRGEARIFVDSFDRGGLLTAHECRQMAERMLGRPIGDNKDDNFLKPVPKRSILHRMLNNLKAIYSRAEDQHRALAAAERIQLLSPGAWENLGDLARLQTETGDYPAAIESLGRYLELAPPDEDTGAFEAALKAIEDGQSDNGADFA